MKNILFLFCILHFLSSCSEKKPAKKIKPSAILFKQASTFRDSGKKDSAFFYFNKAKDEYLLLKDTVGAGVCLVNMGIISTDIGDLFGGQELSLEALTYFDESNPVHDPYLLSNYNNLGIASYSLNEYSKAVEFYEKSLSFNTDSGYARIIKNNIANAYRKEGNFSKAIKVYRSALDGEKDPVNYARVLSNLAYTQWLQNPTHNSATNLHRALNIRTAENDSWGKISSYAQLADYYTKSHRDSAFIFYSAMYMSATLLNSGDDQVDALRKLIPLSADKDAKRYFEKYRQLSDSLQAMRSTAKNQFVLIRYETEKHKADYLQLQQENTRRTFWIVSIIVVFILSGVVASWWYRRRKQRLELAAKNAVRESQLKTSKKVHDVVANGLYRLMSEMENTDQLDKEKILDGMEVLYEQSRDISHEDNNPLEADFPDIVRQILQSFATADTKVAVVGNNKETWQRVGQEVKVELKYVLQELMVNMKKHSRATAVAVRFGIEADHLHIWYTDNGIGMPLETVHGNGLTNTGNRIKCIGGALSFGAGTGGGLTIHLKIPVTV